MVTVTNIKQIKKSIQTHLQAGNLELVVLPRIEYETLLAKIEDLKDLCGSLESLKEYRAGKFTSFDKYDARRKGKIVSD